jgi:hypothetical protein
LERQREREIERRLRHTIVPIIRINSRDVAGLRDLDVYGDLLTPLSLKIDAPLAEAAGIIRDLSSLNRTLLNTYIAYVLSKAGYRYDLLDEVEEHLHTDEFKDEDWIKNWELLSPAGNGSWDSSFRNRNDKRLTIRCIDLELQGEDETTWGGTQEIWVVLPSAESLKAEYGTGKVDYLVVHPAIAKLATPEFRRFKSELSGLLDSDVVLSAGEFRAKFVNPQTIKLVEQGWLSLRQRLKAEFQKRWPVVAISQHFEIIQRAEDEMRRANIAYQQSDYTDCVRDAAYACESLLAVLYSTYGKVTTTSEKLTYDEYLERMRNELEEDFGSDIFEDLDLIRKQRNMQSHPYPQRPSNGEALRVLRKAELFRDLFNLRKRG